MMIKLQLTSGHLFISQLIAFQHIKPIKLADKSEFGWLTVNEYLLNELASNSDDVYRLKKRAERKVKKKLKQKQAANLAFLSYQTLSSYSPRNERSDDHSKPRPRCLGPCFKLGIPLLLLFLLAFFFCFRYGRLYTRKPYPVCSMYSAEPWAI